MFVFARVVRSLRGAAAPLMLVLATLVLVTAPTFAQDEAAPAAPAPAAAPADDAEEAPKPSTSFLKYCWDASPTFFVLMGAISIYGVTLVFNGITRLRLKTVMPPQLLGNLDMMLGEKKFKEAYEILRADQSLFARSLTAGVEKLSHGFERGMESLLGVAAEGKMAMEHEISQISIVSSLAPMLGLLGTVLGMIFAFQEIALGGQPKPAELAANIGLALVSTLQGLVIAIPGLYFFALFRNKVARLIFEIESAGESYLWRFAAALKK